MPTTKYIRTHNSSTPGDTIDVPGLTEVQLTFRPGKEHEFDNVFLKCSSDTACEIDTDRTVLAGTILARTGGPTTYPVWDANDLGYMTAGYWVRVPAPDGGDPQPAEVGMFADGGLPFTDFTSLSGTASYAGTGVGFRAGRQVRRR